MDALSRAHWRKSARSGGGNNCVEMTRVPAIVAIRDSKNLTGDVVALRPTTWAEVSKLIKAGTYDL